MLSRLLTVLASCALLLSGQPANPAVIDIPHVPHFRVPSFLAGKRTTSKRVSQKPAARTVARGHNLQKPSVKHTVATKKITSRKQKAKTGRHASRRKRAAKKIRKASTGGLVYMWQAPWVNLKPYSAPVRVAVQRKFQSGLAGNFAPSDLIRGGAVASCPLSGGIRKRKDKISFVILHSTETGRPADAPTVVRSWNNGGLVHPGAQYIVDRNGIIYQTVDPQYATCHVDVSRTINGVTNENSIGIEIVRTGAQQYTDRQLDSVVRLVAYLSDRFSIQKIYGHGQIQPSTRTDPVNFNWNVFQKDLAMVQSTRTAYGRSRPDKG